jgi:DNA-binding GntR family transcriptional regulator
MRSRSRKAGRGESIKDKKLSTIQFGEAQLEYFGLLGRSTSNRGRNASRTDLAISIIRDRILDLTLPPGSRTDDRVLMDRFGMGRTPAREAFNRLAAEGLIIIQRNRGAFVRPLDVHHIREFFDAHIASERVVGYFCRLDDRHLPGLLQSIDEEYREAYAKDQFFEMTKINWRFHGRIAVATRNEYVTEQALRLYNHARRLSNFIYLTDDTAVRQLREMHREIKADHDEIIAAIQRQDNERLVQVLTRHGVMFHKHVVRVVSTMRGLSAPVPVSLDRSADVLC